MPWGGANLVCVGSEAPLASNIPMEQVASRLGMTSPPASDLWVQGHAPDVRAGPPAEYVPRCGVAATAEQCPTG